MNDALRTILPIAGWSNERASEVEITGGTDPVLPVIEEKPDLAVVLERLAAVWANASNPWEFGA